MLNPHKGKTGLRRLINAVGYSINGLRAAYRLEDAFRQEIALAAVLIAAALLLPVAATGRALLLASVMLVLIVELLNSAIEAAVDRISLENNELAKLAKDFGSAAVMLSIACMTGVWIVVLLG
jgi:diacylglycerol kinase (ATP)